MVWITYGLVSLYAVLTGLAGIVQWKEKGVQVRTILFIIVSINLIAVLWVPNKMIMLGILILMFIVLHILAVLEGIIANGRLRYNHHMMRFVFHMIIVFLVIQFIV